MLVLSGRVPSCWYIELDFSFFIDDLTWHWWWRWTGKTLFLLLVSLSRFEHFCFMYLNVGTQNLLILNICIFFKFWIKTNIKLSKCFSKVNKGISKIASFAFSVISRKLNISHFCFKIVLTTAKTHNFFELTQPTLYLSSFQSYHVWASTFSPPWIKAKFCKIKSICIFEVQFM